MQVDNFPLDALKIMAHGIYPLIFCDYIHIHTFPDLISVYIPDRAFEYSQMIEDRTFYQKILYTSSHVFADQTFHSLRGPKSRAKKEILNPIRQSGYFDWFITQVNERMSDIIAISDPFMREQLGMTINRAICDAHLCVTSELPYMSKVFFFGCLDKLANLMTMIGMEADDTTAWKRLVDRQFLDDSVLRMLENIPDNAGKYLFDTVEWILEEMKVEDLSPDYLRTLRNSHHGYKLRKEAFKKILMKRSGEIHNDITLLVTPLVLFFLSKKWTVKQ